MDSLNFIVQVLAVPNGQITAIRVLDRTLYPDPASAPPGAWWSWDLDIGWHNPPAGYPTEPTVPNGHLIYIAAYAVNNGDDGNLKISIFKRVEANTYLLNAKTAYVYHGAGIGVEVPSTNPSEADLYTVQAEP